MSQLHEAVRNDNIDSVKELVAQGSDVNLQDGSKRTPLALAAWRGNKEITQILIRAKANSRICAMDNFTALHFSAQQSNSADVIALLAHNEKSIINARTSKGGKTALHLAAAKGNPEILGALIEVGADVKMKTSTGLTAADITKNEDCFKLLRAHMNSTSATRPLKAAVGGSEVGGEAISSSGNTSSHEDSSSVLLPLLSIDDTLSKPVALTAEIVSGTSVAFKRSLGSLESQAENDFESAPSESKRPCVKSSAAAIIDSTNDIVNNYDPLTMSL